MTWFTAFALFGAPLSLLALGWIAVLVDEHSDRRGKPADVPRRVL